MFARSCSIDVDGGSSTDNVAFSMGIAILIGEPLRPNMFLVCFPFSFFDLGSYNLIVYYPMICTYVIALHN